MNLNKAMIIGNVVRDPEIRTTPNGQNVTSYSVATNFIWKDQQGQKQERAEFHNIVAWRRLAEISSQYLKKGSKVYLEGRMQTRSWDDPSGVKKYKTEIVAENMIMLDRAGAPSGPMDSNQAPATPANDNQEVPTIDYGEEPAKTGKAKEEEISVDDIPF